MSILKAFTTGLAALFFATFVHAEVVLQNLNGQNTAFSSLQGKWVFINYWASWCEPCLAEITELNRFYQQNKHDVAMFAVNYDMVSAQEQKKLVKQFNIQYPALRQDPAKNLKLGHIKAVPVTFVFNPQGKLTKTLYGEQTVKSLCQVSLATHC